MKEGVMTQVQSKARAYFSGVTQRAKVFYAAGDKSQKRLIVYSGVVTAGLLASVFINLILLLVLALSGGKSGGSSSTSSHSSGDNATALQQAMEDIGNKYSPIDGQLVAAAIAQHRAGMPWSEIDTTMNDASPAMRRAYDKWKSACDRSEK
jgi:hypothetical protein